MFRMLHLAIGAFAGAAVLALGAAPVSADHYKKLVPGVLLQGISQLNYVNISGDTCLDFDGDGNVECFGHDLALKNPNHDTQAAATLVYSHARSDCRIALDTDGDGVSDTCADPNFGAQTEVFLGCRVDVLTPHASVNVANQDIPPGPVADPFLGLWTADRYAEVIWAPLAPIEVNGEMTTIATGLGGRALGMNDSIFFGGRAVDTGDLAHPALFSLPSDAVVPGQRIEAVLCVCDELSTLELHPDTFLAFGFDCPQDP